MNDGLAGLILFLAFQNSVVEGLSVYRAITEVSSLAGMGARTVRLSLAVNSHRLLIEQLSSQRYIQSALSRVPVDFPKTRVVLIRSAPH